MKCNGMNGAGKPCGVPAVGGTSLCLMHLGKAASSAAAAGFRTVYNPDGLKEFPAPKSAADLRDTVHINRTLFASLYRYQSNFELVGGFFASGNRRKEHLWKQN
jgi:hypothetical protein